MLTDSKKQTVFERAVLKHIVDKVTQRTMCSLVGGVPSTTNSLVLTSVPPSEYVNVSSTLTVVLVSPLTVLVVVPTFVDLLLTDIMSENILQIK